MRLRILLAFVSILGLSNHVRAQTNPPNPPAQPAKTFQAPQPKQPDPNRVPAEQPPILEPPPILSPSMPSTGNSPILTAPPPPAPPPGFTGSSTDVIRVVLGFLALCGLAYLGGLPIVKDLERRLGIAHLVTAGLPFVFLGLFASMPQVGILSKSVLYELRPLLVLGLGWIGFTVGFRFDSQLVKSFWPGIGQAVATITAWPFVAVVVLCGVMLWITEGASGWLVVARDGIILGTAGAMTASSVPELLRARANEETTLERMRTILQLEELAAMIGLTLLAAYFHPAEFSSPWHLPGTGWLFVTLGVGAAMGAIIYPILSRIDEGPGFMVVTLGSISFAAGLASFLRLSPIAVCFIAGVILVNLPGVPAHRIREALDHLERPIYLLFLVIVGSLWEIDQWQGWALMALFVLARLGGKWFGALFLTRKTEALPPEARRALTLAPLGALSIAIVVNAEDLYSGQSVPWIVTAVIGGAIVTELIVQLSMRGPRLAEPLPN